VRPLTIGAWNVRTLLDTAGANRPERRTALVARELDRYSIEIAALSETRLAEEGQITEVGAGYTFFWSGRSKEERREAGVGFAIKNHLIGNLTNLPKGLNDRLMSLRLPLPGKKYATIISAYAPTMTNPDEVKDRFYEELGAMITSVPNEDKLIVLGDFNARVGTNDQTWEGIIGKNGIGNCNSNGLLLLQKCAEYDLLITNTIFRLPNRNKTTWMHPRSKHWHLIDYVIVRKRDRQDVQVTKSMCGADCWTDHRLVVSKLKVRIQPKRRPQGTKTPKRLDISRLKQDCHKRAFTADLGDKLESLDIDSMNVEDGWAALKDLVYSTAHSTLGPSTRKHQDWFDENNDEIQMLLEKKNQLHRDCLNDPNSDSKNLAFNTMRGDVQRKLRDMQDSWLSNKADEIQAYADSKDFRFFSAIQTVFGPQASGSSPLLNADGSTLLIDKEQILGRWAEHFDGVLNRPSFINQEAIDRLPQVEVNVSMDDIPNIQETEKAIRLLSSGKSPGPDAIPAEVYKSGGPCLVEKLTDLFQKMWHEGTIPQHYRDASIVHLYKRKGNRQACDNHRGIALLSVAGKILARILLNRLVSHLEQDLLPESQCGFREGRGTIDMIFAARQLQEKCQEQNTDLYTTFVDLTKAFDTVSREGLWKIMAKYGCPEKFITMVRQFHDGMQACVQDNGVSSNPFAVTNGVKQGCVLAPTLFSMMFSAMLYDAFKNTSVGIPIKHRTSGKFFNLRRLKAKTKVQEDTVRDLLFADDCALNAGTQLDMQQSMDLFSSACDNFGLLISIKKTEVMYQPAPKKPYIEPSISVNGQKLHAVDRFTYLGSTLSRVVLIDDEIASRIAKASSAFGRLQTNVWQRRGIRLETKLKVYQAIVLPTLLYACETWTAYSRHAKKLNHFHMGCLRRLLKIKWQDKIPDTAVLAKANLPSIYVHLKKSQLRWAGHVTRMPDKRLPKKLFYAELKTGKRSHGGQKKRYRDTLKASLKNFDIDTESWESMALDRSTWRSHIKSGAVSYEQKRTREAEAKRGRRKSRSTSVVDQPPAVSCPVCNRGFRAQIGLTSHLRTHQK